MMKRALSLLTLITIFFFSCDKENENDVPAHLTIQFEHLVDNESLQFDEMIYTNEAGNEYEVTEIQYFISDLTLIDEEGKETLLDEGGFAHYVDTNLPDTWLWEPTEDIEPGNYRAIKITFGIKGEKNIPYSFPNPPESDMQWPANLGGENGGYHYMKLNGFWINDEELRSPFNFHIGVGQERDQENNVTGFIQNWFEVTLPQSAFTAKSGEEKEIYFQMNVEEWFKDPHTYDHNVYGPMIMMNQEAMEKISENGHNVFTVAFEEEGDNEEYL